MSITVCSSSAMRIEVDQAIMVYRNASHKSGRGWNCKVPNYRTQRMSMARGSVSCLRSLPAPSHGSVRRPATRGSLVQLEELDQGASVHFKVEKRVEIETALADADAPIRARIK